MTFDQKFWGDPGFPRDPGQHGVESEEELTRRYKHAKGARDEAARGREKFAKRLEEAGPAERIALRMREFWDQSIFNMKPTLESLDADLWRAEGRVQDVALTKVEQHDHLVRRAEAALRDLREYEEEVLGGVVTKRQPEDSQSGEAKE